MSPQLHRPEHFATYAGKLEHAVGGGLRIVFAAPPQHGKSEVTLHALAWLIINNPGKRFAYITFNLQRARRAARRLRFLLALAGVVAGGSLAQLLFEGGGSCLFTSIDGGITGEPIDGAAIIDDYYKNRREAESALRRQIVEDSYRDAIQTRVHPGASIIVLATRWHPKDLSQVLIDEGWQDINLPALAEGPVNDNGIVESDANGRAEGEPLFPALWSLESLLTKRREVGEFTWAALYQGRPRPRGGKVFHEPSYYAKLPTANYKGCFGLDLAYTAKTNADHSVCLELWRETCPGKTPLYYVVHVDRAQVEATSFALTLKARSVKRRGWKMFWRASGTEKGAAGFLKRQKLPIVVKHPPGDKFVCAQPVAAAWNDGRVLVPDPEHFPEAEKWLYEFLEVVMGFTGVGEEDDDDVDALGTAFDKLDTKNRMLAALTGDDN